MRLSFLALASCFVCIHIECMLCSLRLCQIAYISSFSLIDSLIFHRMLSASRPPPSWLRSRNDFSTSVVVRIASFGIVLSDSYSLMIALPTLLALGHLLDLLLSCSEFLFISSNFLAFACDAFCACPFHAFAFRLHAVFSSALVPSTAYTLTLSLHYCQLLPRCDCLLLL